MDWHEEQENEVEALKAIFNEAGLFYAAPHCAQDFVDESYPEMPVTFRFKARPAQQEGTHSLADPAGAAPQLPGGEPGGLLPVPRVLQLMSCA